MQANFIYDELGSAIFVFVSVDIWCCKKKILSFYFTFVIPQIQIKPETTIDETEGSTPPYATKVLFGVDQVNSSPKFTISLLVSPFL